MFLTRYEKHPRDQRIPCDVHRMLTIAVKADNEYLHVMMLYPETSIGIEGKKKMSIYTIRCKMFEIAPIRRQSYRLTTGLNIMAETDIL